jgi:hypothetical protein
MTSLRKLLFFVTPMALASSALASVTVNATLTDAQGNPSSTPS